MLPRENLAGFLRVKFEFTSLLVCGQSLQHGCIPNES
jgi:hypothetical protein